MNLTKYKIPLVSEIKKNGATKFEVVSLFAGGGGSSTGYRMSGAKVLAINEFIAEARKTYRANWPDTIIFDGDVKDLNGMDILKAINKDRYALDLLDGSPPCSAFSTAGSRAKNWGKTKSYSETKQSKVEDLFFEYVRILRDIMPKMFVAENVSGLTKGVANGYLNMILRELRESGYNVEAKLLDARYLGVPQRRKRLIFVGVRNDLWRDELSGKLHPRPLGYKVDLKTAFDNLTIEDEELRSLRLDQYANGRLLRDVVPGRSHKKRFNLKKCSPHDQSFCITATCGSLSAANPYHWDNRAFSVNEIKRIMSIPDDYELTGTYAQKVERLGRMVPPLMMKAIADNILTLGIL